MKEDLMDFVKQFEDFENATIEARALSERDKDYDDHHQWTDEEILKLEARNQAPVVINRVKTKVNLLTGIQTKQRTMPRAVPRTPQHADGADACTEALRFVVDNTKFQMKSSAKFRDEMVQGYAGVIIEMEEKGGENWVAINKIEWTSYYYDPYSRELDFSDKNYDGISKWMERKDVAQMFPDKADEIDKAMSGSTGTDTFDDKPTWIDNGRDRLRVNQHFYKKEGVWWMVFFTDGVELTEPEESPFLDEFGEPQNPIEADTAYIDRELQRYGEVRSYIWIQDEINHRRSRLLYAGSVSRTMGEDGAVDDINVTKSEMAKADGHIKYNKGFEFQVLPNDAIEQVQMALLQESKAEIDELGANAALAGRSNSRSGRQDQIQQQAGIAELAGLYDGHRDWENRVYRQIWNRIKQHWTAEKWIRVTDDKSDLEWVGLNEPMTRGAMLVEAAEDGSQEAHEMLGSKNPADPWLNEVVETRNNVAEMDVDIILTDAPNSESLWHETFQQLMELASAYGPEAVPFSAALEFSRLPNLKEVKSLLNPEVDPEQQAQQQAIQQKMLELDIMDKESKIQAKNAETAKKMAEAQAQDIENQIVASGFDNVVTDRDLDTAKKHLDNMQKRVETIKLAEEPTQSVNVNV